MSNNLTVRQIALVKYLYGSGWASSRAIANAMWNDRRKAATAYGMCERLRDKGMVETKLVHSGPHVAWTLTSAGRELAQGLMEGGSDAR